MKKITRKELRNMSASQIGCLLSKSPLRLQHYRQSVGTLSLCKIKCDFELSLTDFKRMPASSLPDTALVVSYDNGKREFYWKSK